MSRSKLIVLALSALVVTYGLIGGALEKRGKSDPYAPLAIFSDVLSKVRQDYVEEPDMRRALNGALQGMMEALDPFSSFVDAQSFQDLSAAAGEASVGLVLSKRYGYAYVVATVPGSPADESGLRPGDLVESIEGRVTTEMSLWEAESRLSGSAGSKVNLRVVRARRSEPVELVLERGTWELPEVQASMAEPRMGLVQIHSFQKGTSEKAAARIRMLQSSGIDGLLVDVRGSALGELEEAVSVANLFLPTGQVVMKVRSRDGSTSEAVSQGEPLVSVPVVVLIDGGTSGAAEVFAAALVDNGRAVLVGERSNGKGSAQELFRLTDGSALFITTSLRIRPNGEPIQGESLRESGLNPEIRSPSQEFVSNFYYDHAVQDEEESLDDGFYLELGRAIESEQLKSALAVLREKALKKAA